MWIDKRVLSGENDTTLYVLYEGQQTSESSAYILFSTTPVKRILNFHPGPLTDGKSFKISIDCVA